MEDCPCDHEPLCHAPGQGVNARLCPLGQHELLKQLVSDVARLALGDTEQEAMEIEVLPDRERTVQGVLLGDDAD